MPRPRASIDFAALAEAFAPDGLHGVTAAQLAARTQIAKPTLYARLRSKDAVFLACVEAEVERLLERVGAAERATAGQSLDHRMAAIAAALVDHAQAAPAAFRLLHLTAHHEASSVARPVERALGRIPARIAAALRQHVDDDAAAATAALGLQGTVAALTVARQADARGRAELVARTLAAGFAAAPAPAPAAGLHGIY